MTERQAGERTGRPVRADRPGRAAHPRRPGRSRRPSRGRPGRGAHRRARQAQAAFDLLHLRHAAAFTRQTYLLCGHPVIAQRAVAHAFRTAWERWPDVAVDPDPAGWVRAVAHDHALSPWHRLVPGRVTRPPHPGPPADRAFLTGLLALPRPYRRALLLHDGLGLDVTDTAVETESSTAAAHGRVVHARDVLTAHVPELWRARAERRLPLLTERLRLLLGAAAVPAPPPAARVRESCERFVRRRTGAAFGLTATLAAAVALSVAAAEERADPPPDDAAVVDGRDARTHGGAYLPHLRSTNARMALVERDGRPAAALRR